MAAIEVTTQTIAYIFIAFMGRALLRELCFRRLTFFKTTEITLGNWAVNSLIEFSRSGFGLKKRYLYVIVLSIYTTAIAVLTGSGADEFRGIKPEVIYTILLLASAIFRVFLPENSGAELRRALFVPLFAILVLTLFESMLFVTGFDHFSKISGEQFLVAYSASHLLGFLVSAFLTVLLFLADQSATRTNAWNQLVSDVGQITWATPIIILFFSPFGGWGWTSVLICSAETIVFLLSVDFVKTFFPYFQTVQTEKFTIRFAIPAVLSVFVLIWIMGAI